MTDEKAKGRGGRPRRVDPEVDPGNRRRGTATTFGHAVALTGMTIPETAEFLDVSVASVRAYSLGTRDAPKRVMDRMADLWLRLTLRVDPGDLPSAVAERRQAILEIRSRAWASKARVTTRDMERAGHLRTAMQIDQMLRRIEDKTQDEGTDDA